MANGFSFIFDPSKGQTPQSIARQRALAAQIMGQIGQRPANNVGQGIGNAFASIGSGLAARSWNNKADAAEAQGTQQANDAYSKIISGLTGGAMQGGNIPAPPAPMSQAPMPTAGMPQSSTPAPPQGDNPMTSYQSAIGSIESAGSGGYSAVGPTNPKLGRALGKYQVMEANIAPWSQEALGRPVTADQFLASPQIQDAVFNNQFGKYVKQYGPTGAAQAWFGGPGGVGKVERKDSLGTSIGQYGQKFDNALGGGQPQPGGSSPQGQPQQQSSILPDLLKAAQNPFLNESQRSVVHSLIQQQMTAQDPLHQLQIRAAQKTIDSPAPVQTANVNGHLINTRTNQEIAYFPKQNDQTPLQRDLQAAGIQPGSSEYNKAIMAAHKIAAPGDTTVIPKNTREAANELRDEYDNNAVKPYVAARQGYEKVIAGAKDESATGDLALIFGFMKTLDPTSTVREGEFANAQNAGGISDSIYNLYNRVRTGERLNPDQRKNFINTAKQQFSVYQKNFDGENDRYKGLSGKYGVDPSLVVRSFDPVQSGEAPQIAPPNAKPMVAPQAGVIQQGYRFKGGNPADPTNWEPVQ